MVYRSTRRTKRTYGRSRSYRKKSAPSTKLIRRIARREMARQCEVKQAWVTPNEVQLDTLAQGTFWDPIQIAVGGLADQRIGNEVIVKGFHVKGVLTNSATKVNMVRMVLFWARDQANMTAASDVFQTGATGGSGSFGTVNGLDTMYYPMNKSLMTVVYDKVITLQSNTMTGSTRFINKFLKLNTKLRFEGNTSGVDAVSRRLHIGLWTAEAADDTGLGTQVEWSAVIRTYFIDP